jgi:hypothetical protein
MVSGKGKVMKCPESDGGGRQRAGASTPDVAKIKKGQDRNPAPFLNPISYEKPSMLRQAACRKGMSKTGAKKNFLSP